MRVLIADDELLFRNGLHRLLTDGGYDVVAHASDAKDLLRKTASHRPDIVITDVRMPPDNTDDGLRAAIEIRQRLSGIGVLVLSRYIAVQSALDLVSDGPEGVGYLLKDRVGDLDQFLAAVLRVAGGGSAFDPEVVSHLLGRKRIDPLGELTDRERQVLASMAEGRSNKGTGEQLVITEDAVEKHVRSILRKLNIPTAATDHRRVLAVLAFLRGQPLLTARAVDHRA